MTTSWRKGRIRASSASAGAAQPHLPAGTCWCYQNVAYDAVERDGRDGHGKPYEEAVKRYLFNPIGMTIGSVSMTGLIGASSWARPHSAGGGRWR